MDDEVPQKIIAATIVVIERVGIEGATTRAIAAEARVNVAAVNYYFRSKDTLIETVLEATMGHASGDWADILGNDDTTPVAKLTELSEHILSGLVRFPKLSLAHFSGKTPECIARLERTVYSLPPLIARVIASRTGFSPAEAEVAAVAFMGTILFPALYGRLFFRKDDVEPAIDLEDDQERKRYIDRVVAQALSVREKNHP